MCKRNEFNSFIVTPDRVYKNDQLYCDKPAMLVWPAGVFHRIVSGPSGSISVNFATRTPGFGFFKDNFNIYDLDTTTGLYKVIRNGSKDQPEVGSFALN